MRRTPSFVYKENNGYLFRPEGAVGDFLENRRILRILHERLHFPELEEIIDDAEALDSFYVFDGTRFIKNRVINLFDDSEYSFISMLSYLCSSFLKKFNFPIDSRSSNGYFVSGGSKEEFLLKYENLFELDYFSELYSFIFSQAYSSGDFGLDLADYHSDSYIPDRVPVVLSFSMRNLQAVLDEWREYTMENGFKLKRKWFRNTFVLRKILKKNFRNVDEKFQLFRNDSYISIQDVISSYITRLSACLNLPDDRHAEPGERVLVDDWLELFDAFYPRYEKLRAWYVNEKEKADRVGVRV